ncbi:MAG: large conductance mechanosensitive channel protein MscL [Ruminococcaceae bacterium]|nr:large conductance mechanosensitive channel protein MscL [Oscillospiraceae bacterium]
MKFFEDFKKFIYKGNVVDMAVGVVIGGSFGKIVTGLVNYVINPFIGIFVKSGNLDSLKTVIHPAVPETVDELGNVIAAGSAEVAILWGTWLQTIIDFLITAFCIFIVLRILTATKNKLEAKKIAAEAEAKKEADAKAAAEKAAAAAKEAAFNESVMQQSILLTEIRDLLKEGKS